MSEIIWVMGLNNKVIGFISSIKKVNVTHNTGIGISFSGDSLPVFDSIDRCNIYLNNTQQGYDLSSNLPINIVVDTFTVLNPTDFAFFCNFRASS